MVDGSLESGMEVELLPASHRARVRSLQTHKTPVEKATPGSRVAANLSGIEVKQISRGDVLVLPGTYQPTDLLDVHFRVLADSVAEIRHNQVLKIFLGSSQRMARVRLLGARRISPGGSRGRLWHWPARRRKAGGCPTSSRCSRWPRQPSSLSSSEVRLAGSCPPLRRCLAVRLLRAVQPWEVQHPV